MADSFDDLVAFHSDAGTSNSWNSKSSRTWQASPPGMAAESWGYWPEAVSQPESASLPGAWSDESWNADAQVSHAGTAADSWVQNASDESQPAESWSNFDTQVKQAGGWPEPAETDESWEGAAHMSQSDGAVNWESWGQPDELQQHAAEDASVANWNGWQQGAGETPAGDSAANQKAQMDVNGDNEGESLDEPEMPTNDLMDRFVSAQGNRGGHQQQPSRPVGITAAQRAKAALEKLAKAREAAGTPAQRAKAALERIAKAREAAAGAESSLTQAAVAKPHIPVVVGPRVIEPRVVAKLQAVKTHPQRSASIQKAERPDAAQSLSSPAEPAAPPAGPPPAGPPAGPPPAGPPPAAPRPAAPPAGPPAGPRAAAGLISRILAQRAGGATASSQAAADAGKGKAWIPLGHTGTTQEAASAAPTPTPANIKPPVPANVVAKPPTPVKVFGRVIPAPQSSSEAGIAIKNKGMVVMPQEANASEENDAAREVVLQRKMPMAPATQGAATQGVAVSVRTHTLQHPPAPPPAAASSASAASQGPKPKPPSKPPPAHVVAKAVFEMPREERLTKVKPAAMAVLAKAAHEKMVALSASAPRGVVPPLRPGMPHAMAPMNKITQVFLDELEMPERPPVAPSPTDAEVWVNRLPDEPHLKDWCASFGEVIEVFRLPHPVTGAPSEKGYIQFKWHEGAKACVDARVASWSESERAISYQSRHKNRNPDKCPAYPESMVSAFLGKGGEEIAKMRVACGVFRLALKGENLSKKNEPNEVEVCKRLHFWAEGREEALAKLRPVLQARLAEVHLRILRKMRDFGGTEAWAQKRDSDWERSQRDWQEWQSRSDQHWHDNKQDNDRHGGHRKKEKRGGRKSKDDAAWGKNDWKEGWRNDSWRQDNGSSDKKEKTDIWAANEKDGSASDSSDDAWGDFGGGSKEGKEKVDIWTANERDESDGDDSSDDAWGDDWEGKNTAKDGESSKKVQRVLPNAHAQPMTPPSGPNAQPSTPPGRYAEPAPGSLIDRFTGDKRSSDDIDRVSDDDVEPFGKRMRQDEEMNEGDALDEP